MNHDTNLNDPSLHEFTEDDFERLKNTIQNSPSLHSVNSRQCAQFYGLWWKYAYTEGKPSKEMVFNSLGRNYRLFTDEEFYQKAKEGGRKLRLKWIQRENTLYFRTLLLQGGIPLKNLQKYGTAYRRFLLKVIEQRPVAISDIANNYEVTKDLPISTRNEVIFEAALNISKAIWEDTEEGKKILTLLEQNQQRDLVDALKKHKKEIEKVTKSIKIKTFWELNQTASHQAKITLKSDLPNKIAIDSFADWLGIHSDELSSAYNLFCDDDLLATYRKNIRGDFLKYLATYPHKLWKPQNQQLPVLYFADNSGKKYPIPTQIKAVPNTAIPGLWVQMEEMRWIMLPKNNHNGENAFILTSEPNHGNLNATELNIENKTFYLFEIKQSITLQINEKESVSFQLRTKSFDWSIHNAQPYWIARANMVVVSSLPRISFYDESASKIQENQVIKKWRSKGELIWHQYHGILPVGIIELQFCHDGVTEFDRVFNIGDSSLKLLGADILKPTINFKHDLLSLEIKPNNLYDINKDANNAITLNFLHSNQIPKRISATLTSKNGNLSFEMTIPVHGIEIVDKEDKVVSNNHIFLLNNTHGYRIVSGNIHNIKFYNENYPKLVIWQKLQAGLIPLRNYNTIIQKLFQLTDVMAAKNVVVMEIHGKTFKFKAYNALLSYTNEDNSLRQTQEGQLLLKLIKNAAIDFHTPQQNYSLYAVPLNCELANISPIELERYENGFCIPEEVSEQEFIVFDNETDSNCKILPTYVSTNQANRIAPWDRELHKQNKLDRIAAFALQLTNDPINGPEWQILNSYIQLCTQFNLPFSAFDNIRAACSSSHLSAKLYFFLICHATTNEDLIRSSEKIEEELGFRFHWCAFESFKSAFNWTTDTYGDEIIPLIIERSSLIIDTKFLMIKQSDWNIPNGFHLTTAINTMRKKLGEAVIGELPQRNLG